jgi:ABC-type transport system involved in Fe-S cluster assembly fused permease/ATPase subunit
VRSIVCCRALLRRPSLLLCDEVTSSVDAIAEREIIEALSGSHNGVQHAVGVDEEQWTTHDGAQIPVLSHGSALCSHHEDHPCQCGDTGTTAPVSKSLHQPRTMITVAHRLSSIAHCDLILVLQRGRLVEQGTHPELLKIPNGVYKRMWEAQNSIQGGSSAAVGGGGRLGSSNVGLLRGASDVARVENYLQ